MRRCSLPSLVALLLVVALAAGAPGAATAQDAPPPGARDGIPVGAEPDAPPGSGAEEPDRSDASSAQVGTPGVMASSTPPERYFGRETYQDIESAVAAAPRPCPVSDAGLKGLVLAPIFHESSGATSPSSAPSPMTLSRYDEWNPAFHATRSNLGANQSLYAHRDPYTSYPRAYWHPGIGIWQYDSAGLGAPYTAVERMDARVIAPTVASRILARYCAAKEAGKSDLDARKAAWGDWVGCAANGCEAVFQELWQNDFSQIRLLDGIARLGGTQLRTCSLPERGQLPCYFVDPSAAQGARWWVALNPNDGDPTEPPAPLSAPFYVFELDGREHRHWLSADSGYPVSLSASRVLGYNARYRTDQPGSGLTWATGSDLCDLSEGRGDCVPVPPTGVSSAVISVAGEYRAIALDATGDGIDDVLWYAPGAAADHLWIGQGGGEFTSVSVSVAGAYDDVIGEDFTGDGRDDVLWYNRSSGAAHLWRSDGDGTFSSIRLAPSTGLIPLALDIDGGRSFEVFWYGPGGLPDSVWRWTGSGFSPTPSSVGGTYVPIVGDFDGNRRDDIFWYAPGSGADYLWLHRVAGGHVDLQRSVRGTYEPVVADTDGDGADDIFWYAAGPAGDSLWFGGAGGAFSSQNLSVLGAYQPIPADLEGDGRDDILWYAPGSGADHWWRWSSSRARSTAGLSLPQEHQAVVGAFSEGGHDGILWHQAGSTPDVVWYR